MLNRKRNIMIASSYDRYWLVYINLLQVARVKTYDEIESKVSSMNPEQLEEWSKLKESDKEYLKKLFDEKIAKHANDHF